MITIFETQLLNLLIVETVMQIKILAQKWAINEKSTINQAYIQAILPTHELVIFIKFHNVKIVGFLLMAYFWASM